MKKIFETSYEKYSFEFILDENFPDRELVTCVFCLLQNENGDIWLTKNHRWWELPGGHIEPWEDYETALQREIVEEVWVEATDFQFQGYKKITNFEKTPNRHGGYYPFPYSYILFFSGKSVWEKMRNFPSGEDETEDSGIFSYKKVLQQITSESDRQIIQTLLSK